MRQMRSMQAADKPEKRAYNGGSNLLVVRPRAAEFALILNQPLVRLYELFELIQRRRIVRAREQCYAQTASRASVKKALVEVHSVEDAAEKPGIERVACT